jgi:hypothetical protein
MSLSNIKSFFWKSDETKKQDISHFMVNLTEDDHKLFEKFIKEYNPSGDLKFSEVPFRRGAPVTGVFGLDNGFKRNTKGDMVWGYVRDHTGVDRSRGGTRTFSWGVVNDIVEVPFDFNRSAFIEYGDKSYGTLISLFNDEYQFEFRVAHMNPNQKVRKGNEQGPIIQWSLDRLKKKQSFEQGWCLGSAGTLGDSTGAHTHTEIKSLDESCEVFEILLFELFGEAGLTEYTKDEVIELYRKQSQFTKANSSNILREYNELRKEKRIIFMNKYKTQYVDWDNTIKTRYASNLLFNGL